MNSFKQSMKELSFPHYRKNQIKLYHKLGGGAVGTVFKGHLKYRGETVDCVIKRIQSSDYKDGSDSLEFYRDILDEINIGSRFMGKTKYQIHFYGYAYDIQDGVVNLYLLMEHTRGNDLQIYLQNEKHWTQLSKQEYLQSKSLTKLCHQGNYWDYVPSTHHKLRIITYLVQAVRELHSYNVVHCDLKPNNMLYLGSKIKLIDYDISVVVTSEDHEGASDMGTNGYMAPETKDGWIHKKGDIYSLGVTMLEIWFGDIWCHDTKDDELLRSYVDNYLELLRLDFPPLYTIIEQCVRLDRDERPSTEQTYQAIQTLYQSGSYS